MEGWSDESWYLTQYRSLGVYRPIGYGRAQVKMPPQFGTFKMAQKVQQSNGVEQKELGFG